VDWQEDLRRLAASVRSRLKERASTLNRVIGPDPVYIAAYRGYGGAGRVLLLGRVLENEGLAQAEPSHSKLRNLLAMLKRLESDPQPHARVRVRGEAGMREIVADDEGFIRQWIEMDTARVSGWGSLRLELVTGPSVAAQAPFLVPAATASYGVISDMDDTVLQSHVTDFIQAAGMVLLENALTRLPFPGVAAFYRALECGRTGNDANPIFYVSSSPWNLYDVISEFLNAQGIPAGPLLLRDWDLGPSLLRNAAYKLGVIREILATYPGLRFILIGDSAQEDPEIYADVVAGHPGRILAVYIRNVSRYPEDPPAMRILVERISHAGSTLVLADDTLAAARHAVANGWIREETLRSIGEEKQADEGRGGKEPTPGVQEAAPAPTVVIDSNRTTRESD